VNSRSLADFVLGFNAEGGDEISLEKKKNGFVCCFYLWCVGMFFVCSYLALERPPPALRGRRCALGQTRSALGIWVARPRGSGASKAAGIPPFLAAAQRRQGGESQEEANGF
jgi:hypothetical protein